jgi:hypothetical protein
MQLQGQLGATRVYTNSFQALGKMAVEEGYLSWFKGLSPALLRQATYGTVRYGAYEVCVCACVRMCVRESMAPCACTADPEELFGLADGPALG